MSDRFYADSDFATTSLEIAGAEGRHLARVMRKQVGDRVALFNGRGLEADAEIVALNRNSATVQIVSARELPADPGPDVTLAVAPPKGDRFRWLVEKAAELGAARLIPLKTARSVVEPGTGKLEKARQAAVEAAKQCGAARLLQIDEPVDWTEFLQRPDPPFVAHPGGVPLAAAWRNANQNSAEAGAGVCFAVGPEGGFTPDEIEQAQSVRATLVGLGGSILRIETAAVAVAAFVRLQTYGLEPIQDDS